MRAGEATESAPSDRLGAESDRQTRYMRLARSTLILLRRAALEHQRRRYAYTVRQRRLRADADDCHRRLDPRRVAELQRDQLQRPAQLLQLGMNMVQRWAVGRAGRLARRHQALHGRAVARHRLRARPAAKT